MALPQRHALVTGGGSGIGAATVRALASAGLRVSVAGRRAAPLHDTLEEVGPAAGMAVEMDVTDETGIADAVARIEAAYGPVDVLVNNAGKAASAPFEKTSLALLRDMLDVNLAGAFLVTQAVLPGMVARRWGRVINVASTAGLTGYPYVCAYVAAKHAVVGLTRALALETARKGVTVNAVCPGFTETPLLAEAVENIVAATGRPAEAARGELARANPMGRFVTPQEAADAVAWLASEGASAINGQAIVVAGGEVMAG